MHAKNLAPAAVALGAAALLVAACGTSPSNSPQGGAGTAGNGNTGSAGTGRSGAAGSAGTGTASAGAGASGSAAGTTAGSSGSLGGSTGIGAADGAVGAGGSAGVSGSSGASGVAGVAEAGVFASDGGDASTGGHAGPLPGAMPSPGCGKAAPTDGAGTIDVSGTSRDYIMRLPAGYDPTIPYRIVFAFHGMNGSAQQVDDGDPPNTGLQPTGPYFGIKDESGNEAIFVAGQALSGGWTNTSGRDIAYVQALVTQLEGQLCVDESRVFATGFSYGAIMTITVGCTLPDVFRAIAPMSGSLTDGCPASTHSIAYWASHGTMDTTIDISLGEAARDEFVMRNACTSTTTATTPDGCVSYDGCAAGYPVNWCPFDGIHEPPPFSGPAIWAFLSQF